MRLIGKLLALPFMLVTGILYLVCKFLVVLSGAVLGILSGIIFLAALVLFFVAGFLPGLVWLGESSCGVCLLWQSGGVCGTMMR